MRVLIADDEPFARKGVRQYLAEEPSIEIVGEAGDGAEAVRLIRELRPDVVFLDIRMPERDGFAVIDEIGIERMPVIVFVTAYDHYTLRAFEVQALDYLLKPFDRERFRAAVARARAQVANRDAADVHRRLAALVDELRKPVRHLQRLTLRHNGRITFLDVRDVDWLEAADNYVTIHTGGRTHLLHETLTGLEQQLDPARFLRVHRSKIINIDRIREMQPLFHGEYRIVLHDGTELTSGRAYRDPLRVFLGERLRG